MNKFYFLATLGMIASCSKSNEEITNQPINNPVNLSKLITLKQTDLYPTTYNSNVISLSVENSSETLISQLTEKDYLNGLVINRTTNELFAIGYDKSVNPTDKKLYKINIANGIVTKVDLPDVTNGYYHDLTIDNNGNLFAIQEDDNPISTFIPKLVKINQSNGSLITIATLNVNTYLDDIEFNQTTNEIFGIGGDKTATVEDEKLFKINIASGIVSNLDLQDYNGGYYTNLVIDNNSNIYSIIESDSQTSIFIPKVVKINTNGALTQIGTLNVEDYIEHYVFDNSTNNIIGIGENKTQSGYDIKLFKINISNGTVTKTEINQNPSGSYYNEFVIK